MQVVYFVGAIFFMTLAHFVRVIRWELFIDIYEKPNKKNLLDSMAIGYIFNYLLPFKLGEIARAWFAGRKMKNGKALGFSTVIMDRYLDIVCVGIIFAGISFLGVGGKDIDDIAIEYILLSIILLVVAFLIFLSKKYIKIGIRVFASIFNEYIESKILLLSWALIWNFKDMFQKISKAKLVITTGIMWASYIVSYFLFADFLNSIDGYASALRIFVTLFTPNGIKGSTGVVTIFGNYLDIGHPIYMVTYMIMPILILVFIAQFFLKDDRDEIEENHLNLLPHMDAQERLAFLDSYFSNKDRDYVMNYLKINQNISIIRDYSAGSNATTMLCMDSNSTFYRKYAFGADGDKLYQQILWLVENADKLLLPKIIRQEKTEIYCYYDMPYNANAVGLFEYVHSMPIEKGWKVIKSALESLEDSVYKVNVRNADYDTIYKYIDNKVIKNLEIIKSAKWIKDLLQYDTVIINGKEYNNLLFYEKYLSKEYLAEVFKNDTYAVIHGDLTIENIICTRDEKGEDNFYIIDPNTGNVHDSPNLDYGKLLQSIHGGYEFLMTTKDVNVSGNHINFLFTKSSVYIELHSLFKEYMRSTFGDERTRSIYFHEIIHWLRLMPYKIDKNGKRSVLFYAGMIMVINDVIEMYGNE